MPGDKGGHRGDHEAIRDDSVVMLVAAIPWQTVKDAGVDDLSGVCGNSRGASVMTLEFSVKHTTHDPLRTRQIVETLNMNLDHHENRLRGASKGDDTPVPCLEMKSEYVTMSVHGTSNKVLATMYLDAVGSTRESLNAKVFSVWESAAGSVEEINNLFDESPEAGKFTGKGDPRS